MLFGDKDFSVEELDALFNEEDNQETPPEQEQKPASPEKPADNQDKGDEKVEQTKAFAKRLRESTDKAISQQVTQPIVKEKMPNRNDPCPCGSGKKFKNCHGKGLV